MTELTYGEVILNLHAPAILVGAMERSLGRPYVSKFKMLENALEALDAERGGLKEETVLPQNIVTLYQEFVRFHNITQGDEIRIIE